MKPSAGFYDFDEYERLAAAANSLDAHAYLIVLLGGDPGTAVWRDHRVGVERC